MIELGDIRWFRFPHPMKRRPVLILGRKNILPTLSQIPVIPISSQVRGLDWEVLLSPQDGVPTVCVLKPEWVTCVERAEIGPLITRFPEMRWAEVREALLQVLGLNIEF